MLKHHRRNVRASGPAAKLRRIIVLDDIETGAENREARLRISAAVRGSIRLDASGRNRVAGRRDDASVCSSRRIGEATSAMPRRRWRPSWRKSNSRVTHEAAQPLPVTGYRGIDDASN